MYTLIGIIVIWLFIKMCVSDKKTNNTILDNEKAKGNDFIKVTYDDLMKHINRYKGYRVSMEGEFMCYATNDINYMKIRNDYSKYTICEKNNTKFIPLKGTIKKGESFCLTNDDKLTVIGTFKGVYENEYPYIEVDTVYLHNL